MLCQNNKARGIEGDSNLVIKECPQHWQSHLKKPSICILPEKQWPASLLTEWGKNQNLTDAQILWAEQREHQCLPARAVDRPSVRRGLGQVETTRDGAQAQALRAAEPRPGAKVDYLSGTWFPRFFLAELRPENTRPWPQPPRA